MKKLFTLVFLLTSFFSFTQFWQQTNYKGAFPITDGTTDSDWTYGWSNFDPQNQFYPQTTSTLSNDITTNTTISGVILLKNKVYVKNNATLTILPGTIIRGDNPTQGSLIVTKGSKIIAEGNQLNPIVFTSNNPEGSRTEGDWGGLVILGRALNNQPGGVANIEGITPTLDTQYGGTDDNDNSGVLNYVRIEFAGIALEPNKEINGLTFGSVGKSTFVDYIQVSFSGDDSFEWFGGSVDCKHLISYKGIDDDFDTDFGYHGRVQFALSVRDVLRFDAAGDSNCFESDNDAQGSDATPKTNAIFSNVTILGPKIDGSLGIGEKFEKAFRLRRNTSISIFNSLVVGWEKGLSLEGNPVENNISNNELVFSNNIISEFNINTNILTTTPQFSNTFFSQLQNDTTTTTNQISWVNLSSNNFDLRLNNNSSVSTGADFSNSKFNNDFLTLDENKINEPIIYPNPSIDLINMINCKNVKLYDQMGKLLISTDDSTLNISFLKKGYYILIINDTHKKFLTKL